MQQLVAGPSHAHPQPGNLYGVLLVQTETGDRTVLKGCSGTGQRSWPGWVPPLTDPTKMALVEVKTLAILDQLKHDLIRLNQLPERTIYGQISQRYATQLQQLAIRHRERKQGRDRTRTHYQNTLSGDALTQALNDLSRESQQDSCERRRLKQERNQTLVPLVATIAQADQYIQRLKHQYNTISRQWKSQMQAVYATQHFGIEQTVGLGDLSNTTCDASLEKVYQRAAAKLLHYAVAHRLKPLAMAEFWWGEPQGNHYPGQFYGASQEDCQLLMQITQIANASTSSHTPSPLSILYQDDALIVVDKPAGLLSVPGRRYDRQDSVLSRLHYQVPDHDFLHVVHRLDQATSGILVLAKSPNSHKALGQQFAQHQVCKTYEAILSRPIEATTGVIDLPLWGNPDKRPRQSVNAKYGKPSVTYFQVLQTGKQPRIQFLPRTGRTHQLRVHAAAPQGLNAAIIGDSLYGQPAKRLYLHATSLQLTHPVTQKQVQFRSNAPF